MSVNELEACFAALRKVMLAVAKDLDCVTDQPRHLYLNTRALQSKGKPVFFGAVQVKKKFVSYHLMSVYTHPELLRGLSPALEKRMQGKSCFNFSAPDPALFQELAALTKKGFEQYRAAGLA